MVLIIDLCVCALVHSMKHAGLCNLWYANKTPSGERSYVNVALKLGFTHEPDDVLYCPGPGNPLVALVNRVLPLAKPT